MGRLRGSKARRFGIGLLGLGLAAASCRVGYEELPIGLGNAGLGATQNGAGTGAGVANQGGLNNQGGSVVAPDGGDAGAPFGSGGTNATGGTSAGTAQGGDTGAAGDTGSAGEPGTGGAPGDCQTTTDCSCDVFDDHYYWFCSNIPMQAVAAAACATQGMKLVRIDSANENAFVVSKGTQYGLFPIDQFVFIGADDRVVQGDWVWPDGTPFWQGDSGGAAVGGLYENWGNANPSSNVAKRCAGILPSGEWQDRSCTAVEPFVCER